MTTEKPAITRDVTYRVELSFGVDLELQFFGDSPKARLVIRENQGAGKETIVRDALDALDELVQTGRDHLGQLRYEREAAERKAAREAKAATEIAASDPGSVTAGFTLDDES
jgi:hypothetical protein